MKTRSELTKANKRTRAETRLHRLGKAAERRRSLGRGVAPSQRSSRQRATERVEHKQDVRQRKRDWKAANPKTRGPSPSDKGMRQFQNRAKGHHLHQRENHLATALTHDEFQRQHSKPKKTSPIEITLFGKGAS